MNSKRSCFRACWLAGFIALLAAPVAFALSLAPPQFGVPCVVGNQVVFKSSDSKRLICINGDTGKELWNRSTRSEFWGDPIAASGKIWVTEGTEVWQCNPLTGDFRLGVEMKVKHLRLVGAESNAVWVVVESAIGGHFLAEIDPRVGRERWRVADGHDLLATTPDWVLVGTQQRRKDGVGYPFGYEVVSATVESIRRNSGKRGWTYQPVWNDEHTYAWRNFHVAISGDKLVVLSNGQTVDCLRLLDGKSLITADVNKLASSGSLELIDGKVIGCFATSRFDGVPRKFYELLLPSLFRKEFPSPPIEGNSMGISDGVGICAGRFSDAPTTLGFDIQTGKKLWQRSLSCGSWRWQGAHGGHIYVSSRDYTQPITAVSRVDLRTGELKELCREKVPR